MAIDRDFGRALTETLFNQAFKGAKVGVKIELLGDWDYDTQAAAILQTFNGKGFSLEPTKADVDNSSVQTLGYKLLVKASEVGFIPETDTCNFFVELLDPKTDASLGFKELKADFITSDPVDAAYTILANAI